VIAASLGLSAARSFGWLVLCAAVHQFFASPLMPLTDSTTLSLLGEQRNRYGAYRVWGTLGFILTSSTVGFVLARLGIRTMFVVYACIFVGLLIVSRGLPDVAVSLGRAPSRGLGQMLRQSRWVIFAITSFLLWMALNSAISFVNVTLKAMGAGEALIGLSWTTAAAVEAPVMLAGAYLLRRFGARRLALVGLVGYVLRMAGYSLMPSPGWAPAINVLNCVSYAPFWLGSVAYINELAPDNLKSTAQGLMGSIMSLSAMTGALLGGWLFDSIGSAGLFRVMTGCCVAALLLFAAGQRLPQRWSRPASD
jgi:PPP family 3-phenylpropionic acid transporter